MTLTLSWFETRLDGIARLSATKYQPLSRAFCHSISLEEGNIEGGPSGKLEPISSPLQAVSGSQAPVDTQTVSGSDVRNHVGESRFVKKRKTPRATDSIPHNQVRMHNNVIAYTTDTRQIHDRIE
jgi:hypothetical protein